MQSSQPIENVTGPVSGNGSENLLHEASDAEPRQNIHVWQLPVRITHWVTVICIAILTVTGIYIALPFIGTTGAAANQYLMGSMRFTHFVTAFVFTASVLFRIYWMVVGNVWASWRQFLPTNSARWRGVRRMLGFYLFLRPKAPAVIGHNPLAGLAYTVVFILFLIQIITGFALYSLAFDSGFWPTTFGWITVTFGVQPVRVVHDIIMWLILAFVVHHVYTATLIDNEERCGLISSIFSGYKSFSRHQIEDALAEDTPSPRRTRALKARQNGV
jgi:Ni/Fe-hydrogenase 1 B-type cytochrome subunit